MLPRVGAAEAGSTDAAGTSAVLFRVICVLIRLDSQRPAGETHMVDDAHRGLTDPLRSPEKAAQVAAAIDDPCDEGGYDQFCRDRQGQLCQFHIQHCKPPDYPFIDMLRHHLAVDFLETIARRREARALNIASQAANDPN